MSSSGKWYGPELGRLLADPARRAALLNQIIDFIAANKLQGVTVDFEDVPARRSQESGDVPVGHVGGFRAAWLDHRPGRAVR